MNLRALAYLIALAEHRHFGHAAESCHVTQPTLSTQIKKLEEELGVQLVERHPGQVMLTDVGATIVSRSKVLLRDVDEIRKLARQAAEPRTGSLRLGIFPTSGPYLLPHIVPAITASFPNLELLLIEEKTSVLERMLTDGKLDAAILALPLALDTLTMVELFEEPFFLAVSRQHPLAERKRVTMEELRGHELLLLDDGHCLRDHALEVCELAQLGEHTDFRATSLETLRHMVAANVGMTLLPMLATLGPYADNSSVCLLSFVKPSPSRKIGLVWRSSSPVGTLLAEIGQIISEIATRLISR